MAKAAFDLDQPEVVSLACGEQTAELPKLGYLTVREQIAWDDLELELLGGQSSKAISQNGLEYEVVKNLLPIRVEAIGISENVPFPHVHALYLFFKSERDAGMEQFKPPKGKSDDDPKNTSLEVSGLEFTTD